MAADDEIKKEWEALWKKFAETLSYLYDNQQVVTSLENQKRLPSHKDAVQMIDEQLGEVKSLIDHHVKDLVSLSSKAAAIADKKGKDIKKECEELADAIKSLDVSKIQEKIQGLKKKVQ